MDGAEARLRCAVHRREREFCAVRGRAGCAEGQRASASGTAGGADLGGSSKYSNGNFED
jgi:hypothetical protein